MKRQLIDRSCPAKRLGYCVSTVARDEALSGIAGETSLRRPKKVQAWRPPPAFSVLGGLMAGSTSGVRRAQSPRGRSGVPGRIELKYDPAGAEASAAICDGMVPELNALQGGEDGSLWAFPADGGRRSAPRGGLPRQADGLCRLQRCLRVTRMDGRVPATAGFGSRRGGASPAPPLAFPIGPEFGAAPQCQTGFVDPW